MSTYFEIKFGFDNFLAFRVISVDEVIFEAEALEERVAAQGHVLLLLAPEIRNDIFSAKMITKT